MKKAILTLAALVLFAMPALADITTQVKFESWPYQPGGGWGGEFLMTVKGSPITYDSVTIPVGGQWIAFCVERTEYISIGGTYYAVVNDRAIKGGEPVLGYDMLDPETAYLFTKFSQGTLTGYNYTGDRVTSAKNLQMAIWYIEGEANATELASYAQGKKWVEEAEAAVHTTNTWSGLGDVRVLNLWTSSNGTGYAQDILVIPAPAAIALGLIGLGLVGWLKRRVG